MVARLPAWEGERGGSEREGEGGGRKRGRK